MREFILRASKTVTTPRFNLNDLPGSAGRMDLVCRCISNALWISNDLRRDTVIHVVLEGPDRPPKLVSFNGKELRNVSPDERNIASHIRIALRKGYNLKLGEKAFVWPGIEIDKRSFESLVKEKSGTSQLIYLHPKGKDIREVEFDENVCIVLGDYIGMPRACERLLERLKAQKVSVGPIVYFSSVCISLVHNELDRRWIK